MDAANHNGGTPNQPNEEINNSMDIDQPWPDMPNKDVNNNSSTQEHTRVPCPIGTAGRHFNLQREMGLQSDCGLYNQIQQETCWAFNQAGLPLLPFKQQDPQTIFAITQAMKERFPFLGKFVRPAVWPVIDMIKLLLRNHCAYHTAMGIALPMVN
ncbi:hypothetical protein B0J17DRAFT_718111 [Rhizoctonia solani]|nr:hypothetical protein B0J17DRAFT_718111 [Rhizoctonia solani]